MRYSAPDTCPSLDGYLADVRSRASNLTLEPTREPATVTDGDREVDAAVDVKVEPGADARAWIGRVSITGPLALEREVRSERCEDVVAALALITVLRLEGSDSRAAGAAASGAAQTASSTSGSSSGEPSAATGVEVSEPGSTAAPAEPPAPPVAPEVAARFPTNEPGVPAPDETPPSPGPPPESRADPEGLAAPEPEAPTPDEGAPSRGDDERTASISRSSDPEPPGGTAGEPSEAAAAIESEDSGSASSEAEGESPFQWPALSPGLAALAGYATVPSHAFRAALELELRIGEGRSSWLSSLSFAYARGNDPVAPGDLGLTLLTLELALCPPSVIAEPSFWISACASVRGGGVRLAFTSTEPAVEPRDAGRPWLAVGPLVRMGVPLSERWALRGTAGLAVQLVRDTFAVRLGADDDPTAEIMPLYRPEPISIELGAGIGYSF